MVFSPKKVSRYPRLDTVLMVERAIVEAKGDFTAWALWKSLPKKVMWQTFELILDYLKESGKILFTADRHVIWVWSPHGVEDLKKRGLVVS